jgi:hypothetical protein
MSDENAKIMKKLFSTPKSKQSRKRRAKAAFNDPDKVRAVLDAQDEIINTLDTLAGNTNSYDVSEE